MEHYSLFKKSKLFSKDKCTAGERKGGKPRLQLDHSHQKRLKN